MLDSAETVVQTRLEEGGGDVRPLDIRRLTETTAEQRMQFYSAMYPHRAAVLTAHWRWWYGIGVDPRIEPLVALFEDRVIGHLGTMPLRLSIGGEVRPGAWALDLGVLPEARNRRVGRRLFRALSETQLHMLGHGNTRSVPIATRYCGWLRKAGIYRCALPLRPLRVGSRGGLLRIGAPVFDPAWVYGLRALLGRAPRLEPCALPGESAIARNIEPARECGNGIIRDEDWVRWRFFDGPFRDSYRAFQLDGCLAAPKTQPGAERITGAFLIIQCLQMRTCCIIWMSLKTKFIVFRNISFG